MISNASSVNAAVRNTVVSRASAVLALLIKVTAAPAVAEEYVRVVDGVVLLVRVVFVVGVGACLLVDPVDDARVLLSAVDRRLDAVLQERVEDFVLLHGVGVHALEAAHGQL